MTSHSPAAPLISIEAVNKFIATAFQGDPHLRPILTELAVNFAVVSLKVSEPHIRPGGYISGPTQMALADQAAYCAIFSRLGIVPMAVTSNLSIDFLRPCLGTHIIAKAKILKLGQSLAVITVDIFGSNSTKPASRASVTYALPKSH